MKTTSKKKLIKKFDPNGVGQKGRLFGLPFDYDSSQIIVIPVPWDVTTSYKDGASKGPKNLLEVSTQIDLFMPSIKDAWKYGIYMLPIDDGWVEKNDQARNYTQHYIRFLEGEGFKVSKKDEAVILKSINALSDKINHWVFAKASEALDKGKVPVVLGGDHSAPYGLIKAMTSKYLNFGVLQIDAHADLRHAYQGFNFSHASIMHNILQLDGVEKLVQVGIRDICEEEFDLINSDERIVTFFDHQLAREQFEGRTWQSQVDEIIDALPDSVYISLDVDGLAQNYCPGTGTPVPGGLSFNQLIYLFERINEAGKQIISFDVCEISGRQGDWDAIVGSRLLYNLANITAQSQKLPQD